MKEREGVGLLAVAAFALAASCASPPARSAVPESGPGPAATAAASALATPTATACDAGHVDPSIRDAMRALEARDFARADTLLLDRVAAAPTDLAADVALDATRALVEELRQAESELAARTPPVTLVAGSASPRVPSSLPRPTWVEEQAPPRDGANGPFSFTRTPVEEWRRFAPNPPHVATPPPRVWSMQRTAEDQAAIGTVAGASVRLVLSAKDKKPRVFLARAQPIADAQLIGDVLLVVVRTSALDQVRGAPRTPPEVSAYDVASGALLWTRAASYAVRAGAYVMIDSPAGLDVVDVGTGATTAAIALPEQPRALVRKGDMLYALGTKHDFAYRMTPHAEPPAAFEARDVSPTFLSKDGACLFATAFDALGRRDLAAVDVALGSLRTHERPGALLDQVARARDRVAAWTEKRPTDRVDLTRVAPTVLPPPPWVRTPPTTRPTAPRRRVAVTQRSSIAFRAWDQPERESVRPDEIVRLAPSETPPPGARQDLPRFYGVAPLGVATPMGPDALLLYGQRWLAIVRAQAVETLFDLDAYSKPPITKPAHAFPGSPSYVDEAVLRDGVLYLCNSGGSYADMARGKKSFVTALAYPSARLLWQSDTLVCGAPLVFWRDYIVTGYGFTAEPDFLYVLRKDDGSVAAKVPVDTAPAEVLLDGDQATVHTYERKYVFALSER